MTTQTLPFMDGGKPLPLARGGKPHVTPARPSWRFSPEIASLICRHVARGGSLRGLEAMKVCSRPTVTAWRRANADFDASFRQALAKRDAARRSWAVLKWFKGPVAPECSDSPLLQDAFRKWFGIGRQGAEIVTVLFRRAGEPMFSAGIAEAIGTTPRTVIVEMVVLRAAMECEAIDHDKGQGYWLTEIGIAECKAALCRMAEEYVRMGEELRRAG